MTGCRELRGVVAARSDKMEGTVSTLSFEDRPPQLDRVSPYDERHLASYIRLLDAAAEGADWREAVAIIFGLDPEKEPERARIVHDSHLARARWMTEKGYRHLLEPRLQ
jgi:hypothetical protein